MYPYQLQIHIGRTYSSLQICDASVDDGVPSLMSFASSRGSAIRACLRLEMKRSFRGAVRPSSPLIPFHLISPSKIPRLDSSFFHPRRRRNCENARKARARKKLEVNQLQDQVEKLKQLHARARAEARKAKELRTRTVSVVLSTKRERVRGSYTAQHQRQVTSSFFVVELANLARCDSKDSAYSCRRSTNCIC